MRLSIRISITLFLALQTAMGVAQTIRLEAEMATLSGPNVKVVKPETGDNTAPRFSGTGYVTDFKDPTDQAKLSFKVKTAGLYTLSVAYKSRGKRGYEIDVNGLLMSGIFAASDNPGFTLQSVGEVELVEGKNEITIDRGWGYYDIDYLEIAPAAKLAPPLVITTPTVDRLATPEARALLRKLDETYGKSTMLGVYSDDDAAYVKTVTGVLPAIMGGDMIDYSPQRAIHRSNEPIETERLIAEAKAGYIVTLSWHWSSPSGVKDTPAGSIWRSFYTDATNFDLAKAMADPASTDHALLLSDIDTIAIQLKKLQDAGVPVLWRPLHEADGGWFWWGAKGPEPFVQLWQMMFHRLTEVDGIHNLVWVYTSDANPMWYPGDAFVDVVGIDEYPKDLHDPQSAFWDKLQQQFGGRKPLTISEFGGVPDVPRMQRMGEYWSYAISWSGKEGPKKNDPADLKRIYTSPGATTRAVPATAPKPLDTPPETPPAGVAPTGAASPQQ